MIGTLDGSVLACGRTRAMGRPDGARGPIARKYCGAARASQGTHVGFASRPPAHSEAVPKEARQRSIT
jgi:hypothetical protein